MLKKILILLLTITATGLHAQNKTFGEWQLLNATKNVDGYLYNIGNGLTEFRAISAQSAWAVSTILAMQTYIGALDIIYVTDTIRGGIFYYEVTDNDADNGVIFSAAVGKGAGKWRRLIDASEQINPLWWGITLNDSTVDNAPLINSAIRYASKKGQAVTLNDSGYYGIMTTINVPKSATLTVGEKVNIVHYGTDGVSMFTIGDSSSLIIEGIAYLNRRIATGLYMEGAVNTYKTATTHIQFNIKGNNMIGQKGVELISDGGGVYGSAPVGYINDFNIIARDLDYFIYASATNQGNINNLRIKIEAGNCIHGIYLYSDTSKVPPNYTTGKTSLAYFNLEGNIRVGQSTESMIYMDGAEESIIDLKIEDYGRYADTSLPTAAVYITSRSKQNSFRIKSFKTQFIHDEGVGNTFDVHSNTGGTLSQDLSPQNNSIYPNGTVTRFAGGLQSDYLFGSGSIYNAALGNGAKPGIIVSTNSNTTDSLYTMFMEEVDPASKNVAIYDANTTEKTIKIAFDQLIQGHTIGVEFGTDKYAPRYCKIEAYSDDDNVRYTLMETDTNWNGNSLMAVFAGKRLRTVTKCYQLGSLYNCKDALIGSYLPNVDTLYITVKGNNWKENVDNIKINRIWLLVDSKNPKNIITSVGVDGQNNTIYQPIKAYGDFDFYNSEIDMHGDTIRNAFVYGGMQILGNIGDWDATGRFAGFYTFNAGNTAGTEPPSSTDIGTVIFSIVSASTPFWDGTQGATMVAVDNIGNTFTRGYSSGTGLWSAWSNITSELALKLNISDTTPMLSPYLRSNVANAAYAALASSNTWTTGAQSMAAATSLLIPASEAYAPTAGGSIGYNSTQKTTVAGGNGLTGSFVRVVGSGSLAQSLTNSTADDQNYNSLFTIPANYLIAGKTLRITINLQLVTGHSTVTTIAYLKLGSTKVQTTPATNFTNSLTTNTTLVYTITGTAAAGASVNVDIYNQAGFTNGVMGSTTQPVALATNGTLTIVPGVTFSGIGSTETLTLGRWIIEEIN